MTDKEKNILETFGQLTLEVNKLPSINYSYDLISKYEGIFLEGDTGLIIASQKIQELERIFSSAVIMAGIVGGVFLGWGGIERYRKIWDDIYKMVLIASFSFIAVLGNLIREYLPFNLLFVIFVINVGAVLIRIYLNNKNVGY